jgi:hypothetical protein
MGKTGWRFGGNAGIDAGGSTRRRGRTARRGYESVMTWSMGLRSGVREAGISGERGEDTAAPVAVARTGPRGSREAELDIGRQARSHDVSQRKGSVWTGETRPRRRMRPPQSGQAPAALLSR